jgi:hypothetical protein
VELGGAGWLRGGGGAAELRRPEVREGDDSRGPLDGETREKRPARKARKKKGKHTPAETPLTRGLDGPAKEVSACGDSEASGSRLGRRLNGPQGRPGRK